MKERLVSSGSPLSLWLDPILLTAKIKQSRIDGKFFYQAGDEVEGQLDELGGKGHGLLEMRELGFNVPRTFVIPASIGRKLYEASLLVVHLWH